MENEAVNIGKSHFYGPFPGVKEIVFLEA